MSVDILMLYNQISELMLQEFLISWLKKRVRHLLAHTVISNAFEGVFSYLNSYPRVGDSHMKQTGMLVVSFRGVNFGFWSCLGCSR